jgi:indolepyruvate ferredoxin oxidoreductase
MKVDPRFLTADGPEIFTGNELLIKGALETTGGVHLLGGYPGSPIAGYFDTMAAIKDLLAEKGIRALMNDNEALAAAMLNGTQTLPCRAMIAMKSVGVHVAADALALANLAGAHRQGGAVLVCGDDPWSDSTQVPSDSRYIAKHLQMPVIEPSTPQEIKDYVNLSFALSAQSELVAAYVLTTNLADGGGTVQCRPNQYPVLNARQRIDLDTALIDLNKRVLLPPKTWWQEESLPSRHERAVQAARQLGLNQMVYPSSRRKAVGFITSGLAHAYLLQAMFEMGVLGEWPVLKLGLTYPVDGEMVRRLSAQCQRIIVVEERRGFIEEQVSDIILKDRQRKGAAGAEVWGKQFPLGMRGLPETRGLHPSIIISRLAPLLKELGSTSVALQNAEVIDREIEVLDATAQAAAEISGLPQRTPTFCPGCPHRDSAALCLEIQKSFRDETYMRGVHGRKPVDLLFHGDTGCYTMLMFPPTTTLMHDYSGMGLGGATGVGTSSFVTNKEVVFMGDSTFFHSGQLAISQAVKLRQDITFIVLDNSTTAMTGHQPTPGVAYDILGNPTPVQNIEEIVSSMSGDSGMTVVRFDPEKRDEYRKLLEKVFLADGVKVVIADKECGITRTRRKRRQERAIAHSKGFLPVWEHMNVNLEACRFCLACAEMTGCPGLRHTMTDYGPKMDTDITWCVSDGACERVGACSSFEQVTVLRRRAPRSRIPELHLEDIPEPARRSHDDLWRCCLVGVGGMGIGLATAIIVRAGHKEGYEVIFLDKKGLAIRNGAVTSQIVYNVSNKPVTAVIPFGKADLLLGIDVLEAARAIDPAMRTRIASRDRTAAVINTDKITTINGLMGREDFDVEQLVGLIRAHTSAEDFLARDISRICEKYLGSKLYANVMMLGFAFQKGLIPVSMHSMAWAIKDTIHTDFRKNLYAFNMGRKLVVSPELFGGPPRRQDWRDVLDDKCRHVIRRYGRRGQRLSEGLRELMSRAAADLPELSEGLKRDMVIRACDCLRWGGLSYATRYVRAVVHVHQRQRALGQAAAGDYPATREVIHNLARAMLIKDGVFLAELATSPEKYARDRDKYNVSPANGDRLKYRHLWHVELGGRSMRLSLPHAAMRALRHLRVLRTLPWWHSDQRAFRDTYLRAAMSFEPRTPQDLSEALMRLSSPQCMQCLNPRCQDQGCPLQAPVPQWVSLAQRELWSQAARALAAANPFPEFTSLICPAPCQKQCKLAHGGSPVQVRDMEHQVVRHAMNNGLMADPPPGAPSGRQVAVVGSGPAALAAARKMAIAGHSVTVFEKDPQPGGLLRYGIPQHRLPKELLDKRIERLKELGVRFRTSTRVGQDITGMRLREEFDAVLIATGAARPRDLKLPGRQNQGIVMALDFLHPQGRYVVQAADAAASPCHGRSVVVIGGGETGNDCVELALRSGAKEVHQLEILPKPACDQGEPAEQRLHRHFSVTTREFVGDWQLQAVRAAQVRWQATPTGKSATEVEGTEFTMAADLAVLAVGFDAVVDVQLAEQLGLALDDKARPILDDFASSTPGVFVAGDLATGPALVAKAIATGQKAAARVEQFLSSLPVGSGQIS